MRSGQGQSAATIDKERRIGSAMSVGMKIANARFGGRGYRFWSFDANCGSGWNDDVRVPGSPLVFLKVAQEYLPGMRPTPFFCDFDRKAMHSLLEKLKAQDCSDVEPILLPGDNEEGLEVFAECIRSEEKPQYAVGSLLVDPNGYFYRRARDGSGAPVNALDWFTKEFPRIDIILNLNMRAFYLQRAHAHDVRAPTDVLRSLNRSNWLGAEANAGSARFVLAVGRNIETGDHKSLGLHDWRSTIGQSILDVSATGEIENALPELPGIFGTPGIPGRSQSGDAQSKLPLSVRSASNGSSPHQISTMGNVRRSVESQTDMSQLPLPGAWEA